MLHCCRTSREIACGYLIVAMVVLSFFLPSVSFAQEEDKRKEELGGEVEAVADNLQYLQAEHKLVGKGNVVVVYGAVEMTADEAEIKVRGVIGIGRRRSAAFHGSLSFLQRCDELRESGRGKEREVRDQHRFGAIFFRRDEYRLKLSRERCCGEHAVDRTDRTVETEFADNEECAHDKGFVKGDLARREEEREGYGEIEPSAVFPHIRWREIDGHSAIMVLRGLGVAVAKR